MPSPTSINVPALLGGAPLRPQGPPIWPSADPEIDEVLRQAGRDGLWGKYQAEHSERLGAWLREYHQVEHVLLCGSGNYAVELALRALNIGPGDEVLLAAYDYPGNFLSIHAVGATPVLVDVAPHNWNLSPHIEGAIGPATKAILASHLHGGMAPIDALLPFAQDRGLRVIEDASQAPGAILHGRRAGTSGHVGTLSFGGSKLLCAGRGGALLTRDAGIAQRARNHLMRAGNIVCPLSELQAAVLMPQVAKLDERNARRWQNVQVLRNALADIPGVRVFDNPTPPDLPAFFKVGVQLDAAAFGLSRALLIKALRAEGFAVDEGFAAAHHARSPLRYRQGMPLEEAERAHQGCVQLHHPILLEGVEEMHRLAEAWRRIHHHAAALGV
jgi:dTDP-4-amino-4,6-dideoxygalactose transaminase